MSDPLEWRKSTYSSNGDCVEIAFGDGGSVFVRDSKRQHGVVLEFTPEEWDAFLKGVHAGEFNMPTQPKN